MNRQEIILKENIMRRVRFIYGVKSLPRVFVPKIALLASLVAAAGFFVSVPNVLRNMPSFLELPKVLRFLTAAFLNTRFAIQAIAIGTLIVLFYMARDVIKTFRLATQKLNAA
ncbi:MAG: hypothetical protein HYV67_00300 [Candidatus Taylorbacteria bacterium]|nr:hypothetical protein [Candidatus Taylorbacteria bacterium]